MTDTAHPTALLAAFFGHTFLSYDAIDATSRDYDFGENYNPDAGCGDAGWRVAYHPNVEAQLGELDIVEIPVAGHVISVELTVRDAEGEFTVSLPEHENEEVSEEALLKAVRAKLAEFGIDAEVEELGETIEVDNTDGPFEALCKLCEIDSDIFDEDGDEAEEQWHPMMNYLHPLPGGVRCDDDEWHRAMCNMTLVEVDGEQFLALTGGGMDMTWYICETYLRCGYLPPAECAGSLPRMGGSGKSEKDRMIMAACKLSLEARRDRASCALEDLERHMAETMKAAEAS